MDTKELITAAEAAQMFSISVNAFRICVHRHGRSLRKLRLGGRRIYYYRSELLALLVEVES